MTPVTEDRPTVAAMQWRMHPGACADCAERIVAWVKANGGEAVYRQHGSGIAVRNRDGWAYCLPGQWVVKGDRWFHNGSTDPANNGTLTFSVADSRPGVSS